MDENIENPSQSERDESGNKTVELDRITQAAPEVAPASGGASAKKEASMLAHEADQFKKELGWLGIPFGGRNEKPGNISALVICACLVFAVIMYIMERLLTVAYGKNAGDFPFERIFSILTNIITLVLGYLFGTNVRSSKGD